MADALIDTAFYLPIEIPAGDDFYLYVTSCVDKNGTAVDFSGATFSARLHDYTGALLQTPVPTIEVVDLSIGSIKMLLSAAQTDPTVLTKRSGSYIIDYTDGSGKKYRLATGPYTRV
jgi:hypothetical protein